MAGQETTHPLIARPEEFLLGKTAGRIRLAGRDEVAAAAHLLAAQARRTIDIFSPDLEPSIYDRPEIIDSISAFARSAPHTAVRIIIQESGRIAQGGHRLLELARRLPSHIELRTLDVEAGVMPEAWLVADGVGYIYRQQSDLFDGEADFRGPLRAREIDRRFVQAWEEAVPDPNLRRHHI